MTPLPVFRLDSDTTGRGGAHVEILRRFEQAPSGVLVGTQMVAKGHDFPDVVLSVVLDADATLRFPDFRAEERTFALVAQLAGRSGRGERGGRVLVQTLAPDARAIRHAAAHDAEGFLAGELERRRALRYPPFSHLVRIELTSVEAGRAQAAAERFARPWSRDCRPAPSCWGRRLASGCGAATAASSCSRPSTGPARWPRSATRSRGLPRAASCGASPSASTSTPSDRPA